MKSKKPSGNSALNKLPASDAPGSDGSTEALDRGYGDEHGGYLVEPIDDEPRGDLRAAVRATRGSYLPYKDHPWSHLSTEFARTSVAHMDGPPTTGLPLPIHTPVHEP